MIDLKRRGCASTKNEKTDFTTKHTKATKVSDIDISKLLNFVLFVTFVVICLFLLWLRPYRAGSYVVKRVSSIGVTASTVAFRLMWTIA